MQISHTSLPVNVGPGGRSKFAYAPPPLHKTLRGVKLPCPAFVMVLLHSPFNSNLFLHTGENTVIASEGLSCRDLCETDVISTPDAILQSLCHIGAHRAYFESSIARYRAGPVEGLLLSVRQQMRRDSQTKLFMICAQKPRGYSQRHVTHILTAILLLKSFQCCHEQLTIRTTHFTCL